MSLAASAAKFSIISLSEESQSEIPLHAGNLEFPSETSRAELWESLGDLGVTRRVASLCLSRAVSNSSLFSDIENFLLAILTSIETVLSQLGVPEPAVNRTFEFLGTSDTRVRLPGDDVILNLYRIDLYPEVD